MVSLRLRHKLQHPHHVKVSLWGLLREKDNFHACLFVTLPCSSPQDPEVSAAFQDVATNPANISKYQNNPRVQQVINKLAAKFGTGATGAGEGPDTFPGAPGFS